MYVVLLAIVDAWDASGFPCALGCGKVLNNPIEDAKAIVTRFNENNLKVVTPGVS